LDASNFSMNFRDRTPDCRPGPYEPADWTKSRPKKSELGSHLRETNRHFLPTIISSPEAGRVAPGVTTQKSGPAIFNPWVGAMRWRRATHPRYTMALRILAPTMKPFPNRYPFNERPVLTYRKRVVICGLPHGTFKLFRCFSWHARWHPHMARADRRF
jgi:hypothetical protein